MWEREGAHMKRGRRRDPSKEPYASAFGEPERQALIQRLMDRDATDEDAQAFVRDEARAIKKVFLAKDQIAAPHDHSKRLFSDPEESDASASASVSMYSSVKAMLLEAGVSARRAHKKSGLGRHSEFNDPETAERYKARRGAWRKADSEADARGEPRLVGRQLAAAIARDTGHPYNTVRTWVSAETKRLAHARGKAPKLVPGDWSQLLD
jgi:hypothetical protein